MKRIYLLITIFLLLSLLDIKPVLSADEPFYAAPKVRPNVLIILDRSGSMEDQPNCDSYCNGNGTWCAQSNTDTDNDSIYNLWDSTPGCATENKISIAVRVLADLLDANDSRTIDNTNDPTNLDVRLGYSRFINGVFNITNVVGSSYADIFTAFNSSNTGGNTPLGSSLNAALNYFQTDTSITNDGCKDCRKNYVILVTDGADTATCNSQTARNRSVVYAAEALYKANIPVFVVGFGNLPDDLKYTLNWTAYYGYGGNDPNPSAGNTDTGSFTPGAQLCDSGTADPGAQAKLGYAFLADNSTALASALQSIIGTIRQGSYSRSAPVLTASGSRIYAGFFDLGANINWRGHIDAWNVDNNPLSATYGEIQTSASNPPCTSSGANALYELYDAGATLTNAGCTGYVAPADRKIYTVVNTSPNSSTKKFDAWGATNNDNNSTDQIALCNALNITGVNCNTDYLSNAVGSANELINFIRFASPTFNGSGGARDNTWRLGDIWHSTPVIVGPPKGTFNSTGYNGFKSAYSSRTQILIVGADDGMLHALDDTNNGKEMWSFVPNNLLGKLQNLSAGHAFFVDSSPSAADVCLNTTNCGKSGEAATDWETVVISGERDGGKAYFALKLVGTTTTTPEFKWEFTDANLGNTWSKPTIGKVRYSNGSNISDKWVAFFGGGVSSTADVGNYVYAVDISDGSLLGSGPNATKKQVNSTNTLNNVAAALRPVDLNGDYYVDTVYFGDTSGRMWRWDVSNLANNNNGALNKFFEPGAIHYYIDSSGNRVVESATHTNRPIYYRPAIAVDKGFRPLVVFGTGNIDELATTPPSTTTTDYVYAIRQEPGYTGTETNQGGVTEVWRIDFTAGERMVGAPIIYGGYVYFVTYRPPTTNTCTENGNVVSCDPGSGWLYIVDLETGVTLTGYPVNIGDGVPNFTMANGTVYTRTSNSSDTKTRKAISKSTGADVIYWRER